MPQFDKRAGDAAVWLLLLTAPYWLTHVGGYVELAAEW